MIEHTEFGQVETAKLTHGHVVKFYARLREKSADAEKLSPNEFAGAVLQSAVEAGWFPGLTVADIDNMDPRRVIWLGGWVGSFLNSTVMIDPNSSGPSSNMQETTGGPVPLK